MEVGATAAAAAAGVAVGARVTGGKSRHAAAPFASTSLDRRAVVMSDSEPDPCNVSDMSEEEWYSSGRIVGIDMRECPVVYIDTCGASCG